jgi:transcriptional regulator with XRE-family HTH domain
MRGASLSGAQIRAARALLKWSAADLARQSSLGVNTIRRAEAVDAATSLTAANELAIRRALEGAGVEFTNGDQPGVRLTKAAAAARSADAPSESDTAVAVEGVRGKTVSETKKKRK